VEGVVNGGRVSLTAMVGVVLGKRLKMGMSGAVEHVGGDPVGQGILLCGWRDGKVKVSLEENRFVMEACF
jgi:hypothetical protein